ncbi:MAG: HEPN domain-containing protein [Prevotella sp.]|nr:HEPN domain-containing protein [Candidatus Prevotella equi]
MSLTSEERQIMVNLEYEKAMRFFQQAEKNAEIQEWDVVANRLYYALFHAVSALLIHDGHKVGSHKGAVMVFGQYYVKTGKFSSQEGRFYSQLQTMREKADYNSNWQTTEDIIQPVIEPVGLFMDKIRTCIQDSLY